MGGISTLPTFEKNNFSRWVVKATMAYFENPGVKERFEKWKKEKETQKSEERR